MNESTKLKLVKSLMKKNGIEGELFVSPRKDKKFMLITSNNKKIHFGAHGMSDYLEHGDPQRRLNFINRFKTNKNWNMPYTPMYLSRKLLW